MGALTVDLCVGPLHTVCQAASGVAGSVGGAASDAVLGGLGSAFVSAANGVSAAALGVLDASTRIDLTAAWFQKNVAVIAAVTLPAVVGLFSLQVIASVLRHEPGGLSRAVVGLGKAMLGAAIALTITQTALVASDQICSFISVSAGTSVSAAVAKALALTWLAGPQAGPVLQILLGLAVIVGFLMLWAVLLFRKAAIMLVAVFAPVAFAGAVWDHSRVWTRRWMEIVVALIFCKVVIVVVFVVGVSAFTGVGPSTPVGAPATTSTSSGASLSDLLVGLLLLSIAVFAPWLTWRFVHWTGMEAASVMHGAVTAGPISGAVRATGSQARFSAQSAVTTMLTGGAGAGASAAAASSKAGPSSGPAAAAVTRLQPPGGESGSGAPARPAATVGARPADRDGGRS